MIIGVYFAESLNRSWSVSGEPWGTGNCPGAADLTAVAGWGFAARTVKYLKASEMN